MQHLIHAPEARVPFHNSSSLCFSVVKEKMDIETSASPVSTPGDEDVDWDLGLHESTMLPSEIGQSRVPYIVLLTPGRICSPPPF